jgi:tRNA(Ser,Leu) C12 N-acetylase TAN1
MAERPMRLKHIPSPKRKDAMKDWNVIITVNDSESFRKARREFQRFGDVAPTDYHNVLVLRVPDVPKFVQHLSSIIETDKSLLNCVSRVAPAGFALDFQTPEEFRIKAHAIVLGWAALLCGHSFHVRMHRRGLKSELPSPSVEQFLNDAILSAASERGAPSRIDFSDPDYVIDVETVGNRAGLTLWSRNELRRLPFLRVD